eukprot:TRINITY_DN6079_c0_g1_i2.p1 TRINITY_DN6079_c0_g1~~TRINITY_DN6079_c0_g1_i2.p1  ORF type:complete len:480 (-),score=64.16 TRINITY_DN6079_c0_g1_i2:109-1548(-)
MSGAFARLSFPSLFRAGSHARFHASPFSTRCWFNPIIPHDVVVPVSRGPIKRSIAGTVRSRLASSTRCADGEPAAAFPLAMPSPTSWEMEHAPISVQKARLRYAEGMHRRITVDARIKHISESYLDHALKPHLEDMLELIDDCQAQQCPEQLYTIFQLAKTFHFAENRRLCDITLSAAARFGLWTTSHDVVSTMRQSSILPTLKNYEQLIAAMFVPLERTRGGGTKKRRERRMAIPPHMVDVVQTMIHDGLAPSRYIFNHVISACCMTRQLRLALTVLEQQCAADVPRSSHAYRALVSALGTAIANMRPGKELQMEDPRSDSLGLSGLLPEIARNAHFKNETQALPQNGEADDPSVEEAGHSKHDTSSTITMMSGIAPSDGEQDGVNTPLSHLTPKELFAACKRVVQQLLTDFEHSDQEAMGRKMNFSLARLHTSLVRQLHAREALIEGRDADGSHGGGSGGGGGSWTPPTPALREKGG